MSFTLREKIDSRQSEVGENASDTLLYILEGSADDTAAKSYAWANTPTTYGTLVRKGLSLEPINVDEVSGTGMWLVTVKYGPYTPPAAGEATFSFDTSGGTQHITQSLSTINKYPNAAPDFGGAIGVTHDSVEGVDISVPVFSFQVTRFIAPANLSQSYINNLYLLTAKVNSASWTVNVDGVLMTFAGGEALFLGASGSKRQSDAAWEINFRFAASPNVTGLTIGTISGIAKKGWEYLWVRYADVEDDTAKMLVKKPIAVYIEEVYRSGNFALLGI